MPAYIVCNNPFQKIQEAEAIHSTTEFSILTLYDYCVLPHVDWLCVENNELSYLTRHQGKCGARVSYLSCVTPFN